MDQSTAQDNKTYLEHDLLLHDKYAIQSNLNQSQFETSKEEWNMIENVPDNVNTINIILITGISISIILLSIGLAVVIKTGALYGLYLTIFGFFMLGIFIYGIFSLRWFQTKAHDLKEKQAYRQPEEFDSSDEYALMNLFNILLMLFFICCLFVTIVCFGFQDYYLNPIRTAGMNQDTWRKYYGEKKYDEVYSSSVELLYIGAISALVLSLFALTTLIFCFRMIGWYRSWQCVNEFVCIIIFIIGFVLIYYGVYCLTLWNVAKIDQAMPDFFPQVLIFGGICSICISVLGFVGSFTESKKVINVFAILSVISSVVLLSIFVTSILISNSFINNYDCKDILDNIGQIYAIDMFKCDRKYLFIQNGIDEMKCPKDRIVSAWDIDLGLNINEQRDYYGCLDAGCCSKTFHSAKKNFNFISVYAIIIFSLSVLISKGAFFMGDQLPHKTKFGISHKNTKIILIAIASTIAIIIMLLLTLIPEVKSPFKGRPVDKSEIQGVSESSVIQIDSQKINKRNSFLKNLVYNNTVIVENKTPCGSNCLDVEYYYELSSNDGIFTPNQTLLVNTNITNVINQAQGSGWIVGFKGDDTNLEDFSKYYNFVTNCPLVPASINVRVFAKTVESANKETSGSQSFLEKRSKPVLNMLQIRSHQNGVVEVSVNATIVNVANMTLGETVNVLDKKIDYSFVTQSKQSVTGMVLQRRNLYSLNPANGASIKVYADDFPNCQTNFYQTNSQGIFTTNEFYVPQKNSPIKYTFEYTFSDFPVLKQTVFIGGIGWQNIYDLGQIILFSENVTDETYDFTTRIIDSLSNKPLESVNATIYTGTLNLPNSEEKTKTSPYSNYTSNDSKLIGWSITNNEGYIMFQKLAPNKYTIVLEKNGYYREVKNIDVIGSITKPLYHVKLTPRVKQGEFRFVLDWPNGPKDLDIYAYFNISQKLRCSVFFGKRECPGITFDADHSNGEESSSEVITLHDMGKYIYTLAVNKYTDISNNVAAGENPIEGSEIPHSKTSDSSTVPDTTLSDSEATISVYSDDFIGPITKISVASNANNSSNMNWWLSMCLDGNKGIQSLTVINKLFTEKPQFNYCDNYFKNIS